MVTNLYTNNTDLSGEVRLMDDIFAECIQFNGIDAWYIPRDDQQQDIIYGEDVLKTFTNAFPIELYNDSPQGYEGSKNFFSKFGIQIQEDIIVLVSRKTFTQRTLTDPRYNRPKEGDLIFVPSFRDTGDVSPGQLFEITFTNVRKDNYLFGRKRPYYYELQLETFKYSNEQISTGVDLIDQIPGDESYVITLNMGIGSGNYMIFETVAQGDTTATVMDWNASLLTLNVSSIVGTFVANSNVIGQSTGASYNLVVYDGLKIAPDRQFDNSEIFSEGLSNVNQDEQNPLGNLG